MKIDEDVFRYGVLLFLKQKSSFFAKYFESQLQNSSSVAIFAKETAFMLSVQ